MSTAYGITGATLWVNTGTPQDSILQNANGTADYDVSNMTQNGGGGQLALGAPIAQLVDSFGGTLTQVTSANQPLAAAFGSWGHGDASQPCIKFQNYAGAPPGTAGNLYEQSQVGAASTHVSLNLPSGTLACNGTPTGEATIFIAGRFGLLGGGPFLLGSSSGPHIGVQAAQNGPSPALAQPSLSTQYRSGSTNKSTGYLNPMIWPNMAPVVLCFRYAVAGGLVGANQTDTWIGLNYRETNSLGNPVSGATALAGGTLGSGSSGALDCEIGEFLVYKNALTDAQCEQIIQTMQDKWCGGFSNQAFVLFFGDSRTRGNNAQLSSADTSANPFDASARCWPKRCLSQMGGYAFALNQARVGDTVTQQYAMFNSAYSSAGTTPDYGAIVANAANGGNATVGFEKVVCIGEIGINDIYFGGQTAAQVEANLTTLYNAMISTGTLGTTPVNVVAMTIVPPAVGTVFSGTTFTSAMNNTVAAVNNWIRNTAPTLFAGLTVCDNAADPRWANVGYVGSDGLHPDDPGYGAYAQNAAKALTSALGLASAPSSVGLTFGNFPAGGKSLTYGSFR